jgi:2-polyprenyl-3-methyl-5-hydroxy-6-metoxy-1,4-benzoquinol methylase
MTECIICNSRHFISIYEDTLKRCAACGFTTANMDISEELLKTIYSVNYFRGEEYMDYLRDKEVLQLNFKKRIPVIKKLAISGPAVTNSLEIGCAYGFFGEVLLTHFPTDYQGIDVVEEAISWGKENLHLDLVQGDYPDQPPPIKPWTDVFMWDVIEHLKEPDLFLKKACSEMTVGGRIYITTGDIGALVPRIQKKKWRMIHPPSHIHYFSKKTLSLILQNIGFSDINTMYLPVYRSVRQIYYSLFLLNKTGKISSKLLNLIPMQWHIPVNTYDIMFITAIKK